MIELCNFICQAYKWQLLSVSISIQLLDLGDFQTGKDLPGFVFGHKLSQQFSSESEYLVRFACVLSTFRIRSFPGKC